MIINTSGIELNKIDKEEFYFTINKDAENSFSHDEIFHLIDDKIVSLFDFIQNTIFPNYTVYKEELEKLPDWVIYGGTDSDFYLDKLNFEKNIRNNKSETVNKHLYFVDFFNIIKALSLRISIIRSSFITFYKCLSEIESTNKDDNGIFFISGEATTSTFSNLHNLFISINSIFDILTKIAHEVENIKTDFSKYHKLSSSKTTLGDKKKLQKKYSSESIFEKSEIVSRMISIRNEIIHNGSWEMIPKVFLKIENTKVAERWIPFPDTDNGIFISYQNRNKFFSQEEKINEKLPIYLKETLDLISNTVKEIINNNS